MKHMYCSLFGHDFKVSEEITYHVKEYKCKNCSKEMTIDSNGILVPLTEKQRRINSILNQIHKKRLERSQRWFMLQDY